MSTHLMQVGFLGVNEGADPKNLPPGTLLRAENCAMDKARRLVKKWGTVGLASAKVGGGSISVGARILSGALDTTITDGDTAYSYVESLALWQAVDRPPNFRVTKRTLLDSSRSVEAVDIAISGDLLISLYTLNGSNGILYKIDSLATGAPIVPPTLLTATLAKGPRILLDGSTAHLFFATSGTIEHWSFNAATLSAPSSSGSLRSDSRTPTPTVFDVAIGTPTAGVPTIFLAYELQTGTSRLQMVSFTASTMAQVNALALTAGSGFTAIACAFGAAAQRFSVAHSSSTTTFLSTQTLALAAQFGPTILSSSPSDFVLVAENDATNVLAGWNRNDGANGIADRLTTSLYSVSGIVQVVTSERITFNVWYPSRPWRSAAGRWYVALITWVHPYNLTANDAIAQPSSVVVEIETAASLTGNQDATHPHVATLETATAWYGPGTVPVTPVADASGNVWIPAAYRNREPLNWTSPLPVGWSVYKLEAASGDVFRPVALGPSVLCAGGAPFWADGASAQPYGFAHAPQIISVTDTGAGSMAAGTYSYVATYLWRDARGVLHRSAPSAPKTGVAAASHQLTVKVSTTSLSGKQRTLTAVQSPDPVMIELWRTAGVAGTGPHYRLTFEPSSQVLINDPRAGDVSLVDTKADTTIAGTNPAVPLASQQQLYTDAGELPNIAPPSFVTATYHRGRLVGIGPDLRTVWPSKDGTADETVAPGFSAALNLAFGVNKTALASLDEKLVIYGADTIDVLHGDGPDRTGNGNNWETHRLQTDAGCINPRSLVSMPDGHMFQSLRGIELLGRDLSVTWIGEGVHDTLPLYPNVTSAVLVTRDREVRFTCTSADGLSSLVLVYDYGHKAWFTRKYRDASGVLLVLADAALVNGVYTMLTTGGVVYRETLANKLDAGVTFVSRDVLTTPISPQSSLAWHRVKDVSLLGTSVTNHDLAVSVARDYASSFEQSHTFVAGSAVTAPGPLEKCRVTLKNQKCQAVQFRFQDLTPTNPGANPVGNGDGPILEAFALRVQVKDGVAVTQAAQQG